MMFVNTLVMLAWLCLSTVSPVLSQSFVLLNMTGPEATSVAGTCRNDPSRTSYNYMIYWNTPVTIHFESSDFVGSDFNYLTDSNGEYGTIIAYNFSSNSPKSFTFVITRTNGGPGTWITIGATNSLNQQYSQLIAQSPLCVERVTFAEPSSTGLPGPTTPSFVLLNITGTVPYGVSSLCPGARSIASQPHRIYLNTLVTIHFNSSDFIGSDFYSLRTSGNWAAPYVLAYNISSSSPKSFSFIVTNGPPSNTVDTLYVKARNSHNQEFEISLSEPTLCIAYFNFLSTPPPSSTGSIALSSSSSSRPIPSSSTGSNASSSTGLIASSSSAGLNESSTTDPIVSSSTGLIESSSTEPIASSSAGVFENQASMTTNCFLAGVLSLALTSVMIWL